jgi:riboflavin-specific deaminase-like protein
VAPTPLPFASPMLKIWPPPAADVDPLTAVEGDARTPPATRPWVMINMIASTDGAAADPSGRSGGLGGPADKAMFAAVRAVADVVVAGAATVEAEDYGPARLSPAARARRRDRGQAEAPRIAVLSASLRLDPGSRLFRESPPDARPVVLTTSIADADRRAALAAVADVHDVGDDRVDLARALDLLHTALGARIVLCEGGPATNAQLIAADLVDELSLTVAPSLVGGDARRIAQGGEAVLRPLDLTRVMTADGFLFLRYARARPPEVPAGA